MLEKVVFNLIENIVLFIKIIKNLDLVIWYMYVIKVGMIMIVDYIG